MQQDYSDFTTARIYNHESLFTFIVDCFVNFLFLIILQVSSADPEGGTGGPDHPTWKITSYMGFYRE